MLPCVDAPDQCHPPRFVCFNSPVLVSSPRLGPLALCVAVAALCPGDASAANTLKARVQPAFWGDRCIVTVDRTVDPIATLGIAIPYEDVGLTEDELPDSRQLRFYALCQDHAVEAPLPNWVALADAQRAVDHGIIDVLPPAEDVLESASAWQGVGHDGQAGTCVLPMGEGVPISCSATAPGIAWDTTEVPAGSYVVRSYTFEPEDNVWARRPGVIRVVDGDEEVGPAITITAPRSKATAYEAPGFIVTGCVAGAAGTTVSLEFAEAAAVAQGDATAWQTVREWTVDTPTFEVLFVPPPEVVYKAVYLRAIATDPQGRSWVAHADHEIVVLPDCGQADGSAAVGIADGCGVVPEDYQPPDAVVPQPSECDYEPPREESGSGDAATDGGAATGDGDEGCGCTTAVAGGVPLGRLLCLLGLFGAIQRRRPIGEYPR